MRRSLIVVLASLSVAACSNTALPTQPSSTIPTAVSPAVTTTTTTPPNGANWIADAAVLSVTGTGGCGWGITTGEIRRGVFWRLAVQNDSIILDEDMPNWPTDDVPYSGALSGREFTASDTESGGGVCQFRGGRLVGTFSEDGLTFEADEILLWGSSVQVQRHWTGHRL